MCFGLFFCNGPATSCIYTYLHTFSRNYALPCSSTVTDGIAMGSDGMRCSLPARETIADSIELAVSGHCLDAVLVLVGCDKTIPAAAMALARLNLPGLVLYGGTIAHGHCAGRKVTVQDVFEAVGAHAAGRIDDAELARGERRNRKCGV